MIDSEVKRIIDEAYSQAKELIGSHIDVAQMCGTAVGKGKNRTGRI